MPERDERDSLSNVRIFSSHSVRKREIRRVRPGEAARPQPLPRHCLRSSLRWRQRKKSKLLFRKPRWVSNRAVEVATNVKIQQTKA
ncbi:hypothetical protein L3X38_001270 [Prunus dulcis]|uniref:Uncharacterized protein n=1 Tax=Prunus dulcis TaxID=3755 RepID=A0AAD4ZK61_PRUDU|nr:hypothetical protein L3X38_001270 [Prunus dulcis]